MVATQPIGHGVDGAGFDAATGDVFASAGKGKLTVVHEDGPNRYHVVTTVTTMPGARTMTVDPKRTACTRCRRASRLSRRVHRPARRGGVRRSVPGSFTLLELER